MPVIAAPVTQKNIFVLCRCLPHCVQPELQRVLYPVFVHVYLQLVSYGASQKAAELLQRYRCAPHKIVLQCSRHARGLYWAVQ